jgi:hypothetical protein
MQRRPDNWCFLGGFSGVTLLTAAFGANGATVATESDRARGL